MIRLWFGLTLEPDAHQVPGLPFLQLRAPPYPGNAGHRRVIAPVATLDFDNGFHVSRQGSEVVDHLEMIDVVHCGE